MGSVHGIEATEEYEQQRKAYENLWQTRSEQQVHHIFNHGLDQC